jgi:hypothetical protein
MDLEKGTFQPPAFRRQIALYCLRHADELDEYFAPIKFDEVSFEGWVRGMADQRLWGDETVLVAITKMWNIAITVVCPDGIYPVYHTKENADIYIVANAPLGPTVKHFSSTGNLIVLVVLF